MKNMTELELLSGMAMAGYLSNGRDHDPEYLARASVRCAEALLLELQRKEHYRKDSDGVEVCTRESLEALKNETK